MTAAQNRGREREDNQYRHHGGDDHQSDADQVLCRAQIAWFGGYQTYGSKR